MRLALLLVSLSLALPATAQDDVPDWARRAVWYQIFPERFRNGDPTNDPTPESIEGAWPQAGAERLRAAGWAPTPWGWDWYRQEDWARRLGEDFYYTVQLRRYGGDLQGILDRLGYLDSLGVTALYLNPVNDAPSLHKYDARHWRHVDRHFGPDPEGDAAIMAAEDPADPATWQWTAADSLFLRLIEAAHARDLRLIVDYSWNHTGTQFWAFQDVLQHGAASPYADWYRIGAFDDPATPDTNEFAYEGWAGVPELPALTQTDRTGDPHAGIPYEGNLHPAVKAHAFAVARRWLDPDGDGDPSDGVDGFRLDVAEQVPLGFWRDFRRFVKGINPDAALIGEIWWQQWPETMSDIRPYLGDAFDGVMHYRWYRPARGLFTDAPPDETPGTFAPHLDSLFAGLAPAHREALMNIAGAHDSPRLASSLFNPQRRYKAQHSPREDEAYRVARPDLEAQTAQRSILVLQFTLPGAPHVYYGDEVGMWGGDDPDNRKPMIWADLTYEDERTHPFGRSRPAEAVEINARQLAFYRDLIAFRTRHANLLSAGALEWLLTDDARGLLVYRRTLGDQEAIVVFNLTRERQALSLGELGLTTAATFAVPPMSAVAADGTLRLGPRAAEVLLPGE